MTLNFAIATSLEEKPRDFAGTFGVFGGLSPNGGWVMVQSEYLTRPPDWQPRAFDSDPACTVMLIQSLIRRYPTMVIFGAGEGEGGYMIHVGTLRPNNCGRICETLERAVAEAYAKCHGMEWSE